MNVKKYKKIKKIKKEVAGKIQGARWFRKDSKPINRKFKKRTGCEKAMIDILTELNLEFEIEFPIYFAGQWKIYDFLVEGKFLIEVDGDYWHGRSSTTIKEDGSVKEKKYNMIANKRNDIIKNFLAKRRGLPLLRFWETDIEEKREEIIQTILNKYHEIASNPPKTED